MPIPEGVERDEEEPTEDALFSSTAMSDGGSGGKGKGKEKMMKGSGLRG